jgi:hypothetical protein
MTVQKSRHVSHLAFSRTAVRRERGIMPSHASVVWHFASFLALLRGLYLLWRSASSIVLLRPSVPRLPCLLGA